MEKNVEKVLYLMKVRAQFDNKVFKPRIQDHEYRVAAFKCPVKKSLRENLYVIVSRDGVANATNRIDSWKENDVIDFVGNKEELKLALQNLQDLQIIRVKLDYAYSHQQVN